MAINQVFESLAERLQSSATVKSIYGDPIQIEDRTIIPVARVAYGLGGGSGTAPSPGGEGTVQDRPEGQGGGGGVMVAPIGVIEVADGVTRFVPIADRKLKWAGLLTFGLLLGSLIWSRRR
jgi:uncharacterized spore protein YtfJ